MLFLISLLASAVLSAGRPVFIKTKGFVTPGNVTVISADDMSSKDYDLISSGRNGPFATIYDGWNKLEIIPTNLLREPRSTSFSDEPKKIDMIITNDLSNLDGIDSPVVLEFEGIPIVKSTRKVQKPFHTFVISNATYQSLKHILDYLDQPGYCERYSFIEKRKSGAQHMRLQTRSYYVSSDTFTKYFANGANTRNLLRYPYVHHIDTDLFSTGGATSRVLLNFDVVDNDSLRELARQMGLYKFAITLRNTFIPTEALPTIMGATGFNQGVAGIAGIIEQYATAPATSAYSKLFSEMFKAKPQQDAYDSDDDEPKRLDRFESSIRKVNPEFFAKIQRIEDESRRPAPAQPVNTQQPPLSKMQRLSRFFSRIL